MTDNIIRNRLDQLDSDYRLFVDSDFIEEFVDAFAETLNLSGRSLEVLHNSFYLYLLFFFDENETVSFIINNCNLDEVTASEVFSAFTASLPEDLHGMIVSEYRQLHLANTATGLETEIAETENAIQSIGGLRTMAGDASAVAPTPEMTHQSSQAEILTRPTNPPVPPPPANEDNRWNSAA